MVKYISTIASLSLIWYLINPIAWDAPFEVFINTFRNFAHYEQWSGTMVFMGKLITCEEMPWYYLFVWFAISAPIIILLFFIVGNIVTLVHIIRAKKRLRSILNECRWPLFFMLVFWGSVFSVIILKSRIYVGWHHLYFVYIPMCVVAGYGVKALYSILGNGKITYGIVAISLLYQMGWIMVWHPHETSFFNIVGRFYAAEFDREEWSTSAYTALNWIIDSERKPISVGGVTNGYESLSEEQKSQIILGTENPTYIIDGYRNVIGNDVEYVGYAEVYTIAVDGYNVCSVFKRVE